MVAKFYPALYIIIAGLYYLVY